MKDIIMYRRFRLSRSFLPIAFAAAFLGGFFFCIYSVQAATEVSNVQALYHLDDASGTNPYIDSSGNGLNLTNTNVSATSGLLDDAAEFTASNSGFEVDSTTVTLPTSGWTIAGWIDPEANIGDNKGYVLARVSDASTKNFAVIWYGNENGTYRFIGDFQRYNVDNCYVRYDDTLTLGTWHYVVYEADGTTINLYVDGSTSPVATNTCPNTGGASGDTSRILVGSDPNSITPQNGLFSLDEVASVNTPISTSTIEALWNSGNGDTICVTSGCDSPPETFYAQIENTSTLNLRSASNTSADILKTLPADWIVQVVSSTDSSGNAMIAGGYHWFVVSDPTDGVTGWMAASDTSEQYISSYDGSAQAALEASSSDEITPDTSDDASLILGAIDSYYNNSSTVNSLYSSDDDTGINSSNGDNEENDISFLKTGGYDYGFPEEVIPGIITHEDGISPYDFNNLNVSSDYGHGLMQITFLPDDGAGDFDNRGIASGVTIPPCASMGDSTLYTNCYTAPSSTDGYLRFYQPYGGNVGSSTYEQYGNTVQSIYANIKDGMQVLSNKFYAFSYIDTSTTTASTTFSADDRRDISTIVAYNGACDSGNAYDYLGDVATDLDNITTYFPTATTSAITNLISEMHTASEDEICAQLHSPATITIEDSTGRAVGISSGVAENDFPLAVYGQNGKWAEILDAGSSSDYTFKVTGTATGTYGFDFTIKRGSKKINFSTTNMPIVTHEVDTYSVNPSDILNGQNGLTLQVDTKGDGTINKMEQLSGASVVNVLTPTLLPLRTIVKTNTTETPKTAYPIVQPSSFFEMETSTLNYHTATTSYMASSSIDISSSTNQ